jgi:hypothetical protein
MLHEQSGTLAYYYSGPHFLSADLSEVSCKHVAPSIAAYKDVVDKVSPEEQATEFYGLNHLAGMVRKRYTPFEPLPGWAIDVMEAYTKCLSEQSKRLLYYLILITTREARHLKSTGGTFWANVEKKFGPGYVQFAKGMQGSESAAMSTFLGKPLGMSLLLYMQAISYTFRHGVWASAYGGPKWADISDVVVRFLKGETTIEVLCDTAFTLAHNTAPIFNKPLLYHGQNAHVLIKVLDVQRAGMVPTGVLANELPYPGTSPLPSLIHTVRTELGDIPDVIDWDKVKALGGKVYHGSVAKPKPQYKAITPPAWLAAGEKVVGPWAVSPSEVVIQYKRG